MSLRIGTLGHRLPGIDEIGTPAPRPDAPEELRMSPVSPPPPARPALVATPPPSRRSLDLLLASTARLGELEAAGLLGPDAAAVRALVAEVRALHTCQASLDRARLSLCRA